MFYNIHMSVRFFLPSVNSNSNICFSSRFIAIELIDNRHRAVSHEQVKYKDQDNDNSRREWVSVSLID